MQVGEIEDNHAHKPIKHNQLHAITGDTDSLCETCSIAEPQTHLYLLRRLVVGITIDSPTTTLLYYNSRLSRDSHLNLWNYE